MKNDDYYDKLDKSEKRQAFEDALELMKEEQANPFYSSNIECTNCGWNGSVALKKGTLIKESKCPKCSCISLNRIETVEYLHNAPGPTR